MASYPSLNPLFSDSPTRTILTRLPPTKRSGRHVALVN
jgi:hypothetical protein